MMTMRGRRGQEVVSESALRLIIVVAVVIIIVLIAANLLISSQSAGDFEACQKSIAVSHRVRNNIALLNKHPIDCRASPVFMTLADAEREADDIGRKGMHAEGVKSLLAGEMVRCWRMVGKGELNPYGVQIDKSFCLLCAVVGFDEVLADEGEVTGFHRFLEKESREIEGEETDYKAFFPDWRDDDDKVSDSINMSRMYAVLWRSEIGLGSGVDADSYIALLPYDSMLEGRCEYIVN